MELKFRVAARIAKPVHEVFEAVADPAKLSNYFTTGGAEGRLETGATVTWDFARFPGRLSGLGDRGGARREGSSSSGRRARARRPTWRAAS
jgi:hypothetical protein